IREFSQTPVIMLTARDTEVDKVLGLEMGADDYVTKPFSPRELMARIKAVLRRSEEPPAKPRLLDIDGYEIDDGKRTVTTPSSVVVEPTAKEFDLLWFLAENAGLAMSRGQILEGVWGYEYFGETRTVDVHIRQLRKKIEGIPIETVWGVGYRLGR
ncbi:MAG: response regulator transcription factor, partial [Acidobacteria bacterium]